jgi:hypothetical protein
VEVRFLRPAESHHEPTLQVRQSRFERDSTTQGNEMSIEKMAMAQGLVGASSLSGCGRDRVQTIVANMVKQHERELAAWNYLQLAMGKIPPDEAEEEALWELLGRARRERY